jgi:rhamnose transport system permease protein
MNFLRRLKPSSREASLALILIVAVGGTGLINPRFLTGDGTRDLFTSTSVVALLAIGIAPSVIMRHIDLSISSTVIFAQRIQILPGCNVSSSAQ